MSYFLPTFGKTIGDMNEQKEIHQLLHSWDGKHVASLKEIHQKFQKKDSFWITLLDVYQSDKTLRKACTWLIKYHYDQKYSIKQSLIDQMLSMCNELTDWESKLHILQLLPDLKISSKNVPLLDVFVRNCLKDDKKFVRAWAYQGFYELTKYIPEYKHELNVICEEALLVESASVKARIRKIMAVL